MVILEVPERGIDRNMSKEIYDIAARSLSGGVKYPPVALIFAAGNRPQDADGLGPGNFHALNVIWRLYDERVGTISQFQLGPETTSKKFISYFGDSTAQKKGKAPSTLIIILTEALFKSTECLRQIYAAMQKGMSMIPIIFEPVPKSYQMWTDAENDEVAMRFDVMLMLSSLVYIPAPGYTAVKDPSVYPVIARAVLDTIDSDKLPKEMFPKLPKPVVCSVLSSVSNSIEGGIALNEPARLQDLRAELAEELAVRKPDIEKCEGLKARIDWAVAKIERIAAIKRELEKARKSPSGGKEELAQLEADLAMLQIPVQGRYTTMSVDDLYMEGRKYYLGEGVKKNPLLVYRAFDAAAQQGDFLVLGYIYLWGVVIGRDLTLARNFFNKASDMGSAAATNSLGVLYEKGLGVDKDANKAFNFYREAAERDNDQAICNLGMLYMTMKRDFKQAMDYFSQAANLGNMTALTYLGLMYAKGYGVERDDAQALNYYTKAALKGDVSAQFNVGLCFEKGLGTKTDLAKAFIWYEKAAAQDNPKAIMRIQQRNKQRLLVFVGAVVFLILTFIMLSFFASVGM